MAVTAADIYSAFGAEFAKCSTYKYTSSVDAEGNVTTTEELVPTGGIPLDLDNAVKSLILALVKKGIVTTEVEVRDTSGESI